MSERSSSDSSSETVDGPGETPGADATASRWLLVCGALVLAFAFRGLLDLDAPPSSQNTAREVEDWLFASSGTSPLPVVALSGWLVYRRWGRLVALPDAARPDRMGLPWLALALLATGAALLGWATLTRATDLATVALLFAGMGLVVLWKGAPGVRAMWLPGLLLLFAVPIPPAFFSVVIYKFQLWTGAWASWLLYWLGSSSFLSGDLIHRPADTFAIIEGCSGMRSVETLTMLSILLIDILQRRGLHALAILLLAPLMAFALNGLRVLTLIYNPHSEIVAIHNLQGVVVLLCGLVGLVLVDLLIERVAALASHGERESGPAPPPATGRFSHVPRATAVAGLAALGVCAVVSLVVRPFSPPAEVGLGLQRQLSAEVGDWTGSPLQIDREFLGSARFREAVHARYRSGSATVDMFLGVGQREARGSTFLSPKTALPGSGWRVIDRGALVASDASPEGHWQLLIGSARRSLVHHWYLRTDGVLAESLRSLLALDSSPFMRSRGGMVVRISTQLIGPGLTGTEAARERLARFQRALEDELEPLLSAAPTESVSHFSLSRKNLSFVFDLSQS